MFSKVDIAARFANIALTNAPRLAGRLEESQNVIHTAYWWDASEWADMEAAYLQNEDAKVVRHGYKSVVLEGPYAPYMNDGTPH